MRIDNDPEKLELFGGLAGAVLDIDEYEICEGLALRRTYAHVMAPYVLAFRRPERTDRHHPGPWKSTRGGLWLDVEIEVALREGAHPTDFNRLNTLWWTLALLRLSTGTSLRMPVVSDTSFSSIAESSVEPTLWPVETLPRQLIATSNPPEAIGEPILSWVRQAFLPGSKLMKDEAFGRAFQTFDSAVLAHSSGSAIIMIWAALETLMRPGRINISKRLASSLAALLEPAGTERQRLYQRIKSLYEARGSSAHASRSPEAQQLLESFCVARRAFVCCLENRDIPNLEFLHDRWRLNK